MIIEEKPKASLNVGKQIPIHLELVAYIPRLRIQFIWWWPWDVHFVCDQHRKWHLADEREVFIHGD